MKEIFQKRIEERAKNKLEQDLRNFVDVCQNNPFLRSLVLTNKEGKEIQFINFHGHCCSGVIFNGYNPLEENTNMKEICDKLKQKYIEEEEENLFKRLESLQYLFDKK